MITRRQLLVGALEATLGATLLAKGATSTHSKPKDEPWTEFPLQIDRHDETKWPLLRYCKLAHVTNNEFLYLHTRSSDTNTFRWVKHRMTCRRSFPYRCHRPDLVPLHQMLTFYKVMISRAIDAQRTLRNEQAWTPDRITTGEHLTEERIQQAFEIIQYPAMRGKRRGGIAIEKSDMRLVIAPATATRLGWTEQDRPADIPLVIENAYTLTSRAPDYKTCDKHHAMAENNVYLLYRPGAVHDNGPYPPPGVFPTLTAFYRWDAMGQRDAKGTHIADHVGFAVTCPLTGWWFREITTASGAPRATLTATGPWTPAVRSPTS